MPAIKNIVKKILGWHIIKQKIRDDFIRSMLFPCFQSGHISTQEARFLITLTRMANDIPGPIVEIGTLFGCSTLVITYAKDPAKPLITVDNYRWNPGGLSRDNHRELTCANLKDAADCFAVEIKEMDKCAFYSSYDDQAPAMVFFDADHSYEGTKEDFEWAKYIGAVLIAGHDYAKGFPGVVQAYHDTFPEGPTAIAGSLFAYSSMHEL